MIEALTSPSATQLERLNALLAHAWEHNSFYRQTWRAAGLTWRPLDSVAGLQQYPLITRAGLFHDQSTRPPLGTNVSCALSQFKYWLRSSGTTRQPIFWADTPRTWDWVGRCSARLHRISGVRPDDLLLIVADFRGASGPWVILEGARRLGCACVTCGSNDAEEAQRWLNLAQPNVLVGKPGALLQLAAAGGRAAKTSKRIERIILTGEGGSAGSPAREKLEAFWGAPCFERYGMTEAGSIAAECAQGGALHLLDDEFIPEIVDPVSSAALPEGTGELVLTNLGRIDRPIVRYRTGDRARLLRNGQCVCGHSGTLLPGGVLGRI